MRSLLLSLCFLVQAACAVELEGDSDVDDTTLAVSSTYPEMRVIGTDRCLDLARPSAVVQRPCTRGLGQGWEPRTLGPNSIALVNEAVGQCVDVPDGRAERHARLQLFPCHFLRAQSFIIRRPVAGAWQLEAVAGYLGGRPIGSGVCVDVPDATTETVRLQLFDCKPASSSTIGNQLFRAPW